MARSAKKNYVCDFCQKNTLGYGAHRLHFRRCKKKWDESGRMADTWREEEGAQATLTALPLDIYPVLEKCEQDQVMLPMTWTEQEQRSQDVMNAGQPTHSIF